MLTTLFLHLLVFHLQVFHQQMIDYLDMRTVGAPTGRTTQTPQLLRDRCRLDMAFRRLEGEGKDKDKDKDKDKGNKGQDILLGLGVWRQVIRLSSHCMVQDPGDY
jgi:hypothetical protein